MKIKGLDLNSKPYDEATFTIVGQDVTFRAQVVTDYKDFLAICPEPKPPTKILASGERIPNLKDPSYVKKIDDYSNARVVYMLAKSLDITEGIEWETIDLSDPSTLTMDNLLAEFTNSGIPEVTAMKIINLATSVNGLTEKMVDTARKAFFPEALEDQEPEDQPSE